MNNSSTNTLPIPSVGLGTWKIPQDQTADVVYQAIESGYRHLDCACDYGNEAQVGQGIARAIADGICSRKDLWVTSKLWNTYHAAEHVGPACDRSLKDLQLDYVDLYLIHFPIALEYVPFDLRYPPEWFHDPADAAPKMKLTNVPIQQTWAAMEALHDQKKANHIGVCNFGTSLLRDLLSYARIRPALMQVELHPLLTQEKLLRFCQQQSIAVTAFSPLGAESYFSLGMAQEEESLLKDAVVCKIAEDHGRSPAQVLLQWGVQRGTSVVVKSAQRQRLVENLAATDFELTEDQMAAIAGLDQNRRFNDPGDFAEAAFNTFVPIYE
jgi:D-xylose reductase